MDDNQLRAVAATRPGYATYPDTRPGSPSWWRRDIPGAPARQDTPPPVVLAGPALEEAHAAATTALRPFTVEPYGDLHCVSAGRAAGIAVAAAAPGLIAEGRRRAAAELAARRAERIRQALDKARAGRDRPGLWRRAARWLGLAR
ncbi:hypothetical protein [Micromonospora carbonacea]|uniref:Uncharacterized protein n=1 Tax=Micromonospora carbonacea TaxID=47853 RepID=A0A1C4WXT3_9ACTN|nr:hypothetical protein [Micromonospora carbonacea]SCF01000.1 hypothetical protein GA0070563_104102 [Micromonospora carbonacea]